MAASTTTLDDQWLDKWHTELINKTVLELGCGQGRDSAQLLPFVNKLIACDRDTSGISEALHNHSDMTIMTLDHSKPLPFPNQSVDVVVASLSLHYFEWQSTIAIINEIYRVLSEKGCLICRLNSINDKAFGAQGHPLIADNYFDVDGVNKRFFDQATIFALFTPASTNFSIQDSKWTITQLNEQQIDRYQQPKIVWEFKAQKV